MPRRHRAERDPRQELVRAIDRLSGRRQFVTFGEIARVAERAPSRLVAADLRSLVDEAVAESLLLKDLRTFFDRKTGDLTEQWVYRINPRHPLVAELIDNQ